MDLSGLKWPIIIVVVALMGWLVSSGGQTWMENRLLDYKVSENEDLNKANEQALSNLGGFFIKTMQYERGIRVLMNSIERYGEDGKNYYFNINRCSRTHEAIGDSTANREKQIEHYTKALQMLKFLIENNAHAIDERVPETDVLRLRATDIAENNQLGEIGQF